MIKLKTWFLGLEFVRNWRIRYYKKHEEELAKEFNELVDYKLKDKITSATYQVPPC